MEDDTRTLSNGGLSRDVSLAVQFRRSRKALLSQLVYEAEGALDANSKPNDQSSMPKEVSVAASWNLVLSQNGTLLHPLGLRVQAFNSWAKSMNWPQLHIQAELAAEQHAVCHRIRQAGQLARSCNINIRRQRWVS